MSAIIFILAIIYLASGTCGTALAICGIIEFAIVVIRATIKTIKEM